MATIRDKKHQLVSLLNELEEKITKLLSEIKKIDTVKTLLSVDEALSLEYLDAIRNIDQLKPNPINIEIYKNIFQHRYVVKKLIEFVLTNCNTTGSTLDVIPNISTLTKITDGSDIMEFGKYILQTQHDIKKDGFYPTEFPLLGDIKAVRYYIVKDFAIIDNSQIILTFDLFKCSYEKTVYETVLRHNLNFEIIDGRQLKYDDTERAKILEKDGIHPRNLGITQTPFPLWKIDVEKISKDATNSGPLGVTSYIHRKIANEEIDLISQEFAKLPNFKGIFEERYLISFDNYASILKELLLSTYNTGLTQVFIPKPRLIVKLKKTTNVPKKNIIKILEDKTWKVGDSLFEKPLIFDGINYQYTHSFIVHGMLSNFNKCYDLLIDNNLKGIELEKECRIILYNNSYNVVNDRFVINEQYIPSQISINLFGYIKIRTDIDVIGIRDKTLLIIECKLRKHAKKRKLSLEHDLERNYVDLTLKAEWIVDNFEKFRKMGSDQGYSIPQDCKYVIPIFVSDYVVPQNPNYNGIKVSEFYEIAKKIQQPINTPEHKIRLESGLELRFPSYIIRP